MSTYKEMSKNITFKRIYQVVLSMLILLSSLYAQDTNKKSKKIIESIYIHTDKTIYTPGEDVWFKAYIVDEKTLTPTDYSSILYFNVIYDGKSMYSAKFPINEGFAFGKYHIPDTLMNKTLQIISYTENLKLLPSNFWYHSNVVIDSSPIDLWEIRYKPDLKQLYKSNIAGEIYCMYNQGLPVEDLKVQCSVESFGEEIYSKIDKTDSLGSFRFVWSIPKSVEIQDLTLCLKADHLNDSKELRISIPLYSDGLQVNFFPEGGSLVEGLLNKVAFKVLDNNGFPINIKGEIVNQNDDHLQKVETFHEGMGLFEITPQKNDKYYLKIEDPLINDSLYCLPKPNQNGYVLSLEQTDKSIVDLKISLTQDMKGNKVKLAISDGFTQNIIFESVLNKQKLFSFLTSSYPVGLYTLTLLSDNNMPLAERIIFLNKYKKLHFSIKTDKEIYQPREKVNMTIQSTDYKGNPASANISLAVAEENRIQKTNPNCLAYLFLTSKLGGTINEPEYYLQNNTSSDSALNMLLMTHGWRKIDIKKSYTKLLFSSENVPGIHGFVYSKRKKPVQNATVQIINTYSWQGIRTETKKDGSFFIPIEDYIQIADNHDLSISATIPNKNKSKLNIVIQPEINADTINKFRIREENIPVYNLNTTENRDNTVLKNSRYSDFDSTTEYIEEVAITASKLKRVQTVDEIRERQYKINKKESDDIKLINLSSPYGSEKFDGGILQLLRTIQPGLQLYPTANGKRVLKYRGNNSLLPEFEQGILFVVDGIPKGDEVDAVSWIDLSSIKEIKVITNPGAALIYSSGLSGVVEITLKDGNSVEKPVKEMPQKENLSVIQGFNIVKEFYSPNYSSNEQNTNNSIDFRSTLYWNPNLKINDQGSCKVIFYNSDKQNKFRCRVVGLSDSGLVGDSESNYWVQ